jgi:hypothetical protein
VNYVRVYDRRCTSSGGTWTYPDWTEETPDLDSKYDTGDAASTDVADADYFPFYDTSASAKKKSLWSNIKSLLKTYFDNLYQGKLTAGSNITMSGNTINATLVRDNYSTTEQVIGKWITGKPLYQKTVNLGSLVTGTNTKAHSVSNMGIIVSCTGFWYDGSSYYGPIPEAKEGNIFIYIYANATNIKIDCSNHYNGCPAYATIQYTKTTD